MSTARRTKHALSCISHAFRYPLINANQGDYIKVKLQGSVLLLLHEWGLQPVSFRSSSGW